MYAVPDCSCFDFFYDHWSYGCLLDVESRTSVDDSTIRDSNEADINAHDNDDDHHHHHDECSNIYNTEPVKRKVLTTHVETTGISIVSSIDRSK